MSNLGYYIINNKFCYCSRNAEAKAVIEQLIDGIWHVLDVEYCSTSKKPPYPNAFRGSAALLEKNKNELKQANERYYSTVISKNINNNNVNASSAMDVNNNNNADLVPGNKFIFAFEIFSEKIGPLENNMYNNLCACWNFLENHDEKTISRIITFFSVLNNFEMLSKEKIGNIKYLLDAMYDVGYYVRNHRFCNCHRRVQAEVGLESLVDDIWHALDVKYHFTSKKPPYPHAFRGAKKSWENLKKRLPHVSDYYADILNNVSVDLRHMPYAKDGYEKCECYGHDSSYVDYLRVCSHR
jgi:hypothetical protein